jgi:hypothetical protein
VVDAGFLELVRLGVLSPTDPDVRASLPVIDSTIRVNTAYGAAWYRYTYDTYGDAPNGLPFNQDLPRGVGHPWPVLNGERGEHELSLGHIPQAMDLLETMRQFASPTGMIPEQIWERRAVAPSPPGTPPDSVAIGMVPGQADGSASPLNWALGQYLRLTADIQTGTVLDRPAIAWMRYVAHPVGRAHLTVTAPAADIVGSTARTLTIRGRAAAGSHVVILVASTAGTALYSPAVAANGAFSQVIAVPAAFLVRVNIAAQDTAGNTALMVRRVRQ